jgi:hypothetical protein
LETLRSFDSNEVVNTVAITWLVGYALHHFNILFTLPVNPSDIYKNSATRKEYKDRHSISLRARFFRALNLATSLCGIGTSYEVTPILRPQRPHEKRMRFFLRNLATVSEEYIVLVIMTSIMYPREKRARLFGEGRKYLLFRPYGLPRAMTQDMAINTTTAIIYWGPSGMFALDLSYRVVAMISVGLGLTGPASWPAIFGPVAEAYTIRRFWR